MTIYNFPKTIWISWFQGLENAPDIVKYCYKSWVRRNPGWKVILITDRNIKDYFDVESILPRERKDISIQKRSNILRLGLLSRYGGVWVDATCVCSKPLDDWIYMYLESGFFVFRDPGEDRTISNWFIASTKDCHLTKAFYTEHMEYFARNRFIEPTKRNIKLTKFYISKFSFTLKRNRTDFWLSFFARKVLRIYPYYIFHYHFAYHVKRDKASQKIFNRMPYFSADRSHYLQRLLRQRKNSKEALEHTKEALEHTVAMKVPVHKLTYKNEAITRKVLQGVFGV